MGGRGGSSHRGGGGGGDRYSDARHFLSSAYGERHAQAIMDIVRNAPSAVQEMWTEFGARFRAEQTYTDISEAYYSADEDRVTLGIDYVARGDSIATPYSVVFHEYGHMTDNLIARDLGYGRLTFYSDVYKGGLLGKTAKQELSDRLDSILRDHPEFRGDRSEAASFLIFDTNHKYSLLDRSDISDMMEGAGIGVSHPLGAGHGLDYWSWAGNNKEIFAEMISAEASHPGSLKAIKEYFPKTYEVYQQMLKERKHR